MEILLRPVHPCSLKRHPEMTLQEIQRIPDILEDPVLANHIY